MSRPVTVICDFDGTITTRDIGAALFEEFAPGVLERVDARWHAGETTLPEAFVEACRELRASEAQLVQHALRSAEIRAGFESLVDTCKALGIQLVIASAGLDLYIEPILASHLEMDGRHSWLERRLNVGEVRDGVLEVRFPHRAPDCPDCLNCKGQLAMTLRARGRTVIGIGDSLTDRCLAPAVDHLFARDWLERHCREEGLPHLPFDDFEPVVRLLRKLTAPREPG